MLDKAARPAVRQKCSKLAPTSCQASSTVAMGTTAVNVVGFFMALLSFRGFDTPSLPAQGEQRLSLIFNIQRGNAQVLRDFDWVIGHHFLPGHRSNESTRGALLHPACIIV